MNVQTHTYSLAEIDTLLPLTNRNKTLAWLKENYLKAQDAMDYGFEGATVIQKGSFVVTAEEITSLIDVKRGRIGRKGAKLLINMFNNDVIPEHLVIHGQQVDPDFYRYAFEDN